MKPSLNFISNKWKSNVILTIGGLLIGAGIADCLFALNQMDLNQIARGLTIFSAGLTIIVVMDNLKTQKNTEGIQNEILITLEKVEETLQHIQTSQKMTAGQFAELKDMLRTSNSEQD